MDCRYLQVPYTDKQTKQTNMYITKEKIKNIILSNGENFRRFELIEHFIEFASEEDDVYFLLDILRNDMSSVIRHEAAAQLLKIEQKKPWLISAIRDKVIKHLLDVVMMDRSMVARHESAEALSYIGDGAVADKLEQMRRSMQPNDELIETLEIARDTIYYRVKFGISASDLGRSILQEYKAEIN